VVIAIPLTCGSKVPDTIARWKLITEARRGNPRLQSSRESLSSTCGATANESLLQVTLAPCFLRSTTFGTERLIASRQNYRFPSQSDCPNQEVLRPRCGQITLTSLRHYCSAPS